MPSVPPFLEYKILGSTLLQYLTAIFLYVALIIVLKITEKVIVRRINQSTHFSPGNLYSLVAKSLEEIAVPTLYFAAFYFSFQPLFLEPHLEQVLRNIWIIVLSVQGTRLAVSFSLYCIEAFWLHRSAGHATSFAARSVISLVQIVLWGMALIFLLDNLGFNVSAIVAGLGIGGVAVALAAQTILGDLFNYFVIFFDRPFEEGDFVVFEDYMGSIENIGIKSTRIRSLGGEQIVISNSNLTGAKIRNYKRMAERRILFKVGITYETPLEKVKKVPQLIRTSLEKNKDVRIDRIHFQALGDFSLNFEIVYFVLGPDYNRYMDIQQEVNLDLLAAFQKEGIEFAYPTSVQYQGKIDLPSN
jgi:small-conductance mechanosensitive channel